MSAKDVVRGDDHAEAIDSEMVMPDQRVEFTLTPAEAAVLRRSLPNTVRLPRLFYAAQIIVLALQLVAAVMTRGLAHVTVWSRVIMLTASLGLLVALWAWARAGGWGRHFPAYGALEISPHGLSGTLEGQPMEIGWPEIRSVQIAGSFVVLAYAKAGLGLALPIAAFPNFDAFWKLADDRLVAKRGLVRSARSRSLIVNTHGADAN